MRSMTGIMFVVLLLVSVCSASASIVIHDGRPGIVATASPGDNPGQTDSLDSMGHTWYRAMWGWGIPADPPMALERSRFVDYGYLITTDCHPWLDYAGSCPDQGELPASSVPETTMTAMSTPPKKIGLHGRGLYPWTFSTYRWCC